MNYLNGIFLGTIAYFLLALGFVFQKKGINIFSKERKLKDIIFWVTGLILININPIINFYALKYVPSYVVNSISALTIVFTIILSAFLLKEKIFSSDFIYIAAITLFIVVITFKTKDASQNMPALSSSTFFAILPIIIFFIFILLIFFTTPFKNKGTLNTKKQIFGKSLKAIISSSCSGAMAGFMVIAMKLLQMDRGIDLSLLYFKSIYLYLFLLNGLISFIAIQIAYKNGSMVIVAPLQYGFTVLYPVIASLFLFPVENSFFESFNILALTVSIFLSIWGIVLRHQK